MQQQQPLQHINITKLLKTVKVKKMKKAHMRFIFFIALIPLIVTTMLLLFFEINTNVIITIMVFCTILFALSIIVFTNRKKFNASSFKRRKMLLAVMGFFIIFLIILSIIGNFYGINTWQIILSNYGILIQFIILLVIFLYGFFRKEKMSE
jgi:amino acid transporter